MKIKATKANALILEHLFDQGYDIYVNDNPVDHVCACEKVLTVEIEGYERDINFGEEIDVRVVQVIRNEVEVSFEG